MVDNWLFQPSYLQQPLRVQLFHLYDTFECFIPFMFMLTSVTDVGQQFSTWTNRARHSAQYLLAISNLVIWFPQVSQPRKPVTTSKNYENWEPGNLCPISWKPLKFVCYGNLRNQWKPKKPTKNYPALSTTKSIKAFSMNMSLSSSIEGF